MEQVEAVVWWVLALVGRLYASNSVVGGRGGLDRVTDLACILTKVYNEVVRVVAFGGLMCSKSLAREGRGVN